MYYLIYAQLSSSYSQSPCLLVYEKVNKKVTNRCCPNNSNGNVLLYEITDGKELKIFTKSNSNALFFLR